MAGKYRYTMNPDTQHLTRLRLLALWLGFAALTAGVTAQQTTPAETKTEAEAAADAKKAKETKPAELTKAVKLEEYNVLGSRIRQTETEGPSPVTTYDKDYIRASGAMTLANFINQIPQNYSGIAYGRASTPNELNPDFGQRTESTTPSFNFVLGSSDSPPAQTGVSGASLRGLGSASTLVLVDGRRVSQSGAGNRGTDTRQGFVDLNTIPLGMVDHIEVITDGTSAIYGADAVGGVINVVLKKDYSGVEISGGYRATEHGGGNERNLTVLAGFNYGKLNGTVAIDYYNRQRLKASQRDYSKNQDHTAIATGTLLATGAPVYGRDYRLNFGYPAVVQAVGGTVSGTFNAIPGVRVVLVPTGSATTPTIAQFIPTNTVIPPASVVNAAGQRKTNTANYMDLMPESERTGISGNLTYHFDNGIEGYFGYRSSKNESSFQTQPVTSITGGFGSAATLPAAFNPFNQNVGISMILAEYGSSGQTLKTIADAGTLGARGKVGKTWQWDAAATWDSNKTNQSTRFYNGANFVNLMTKADPAQRFNPFIDAFAPGAPSQAALVETLALFNLLNTESGRGSFDFTADGDLFDIPGGTVKMAFGASTAYDEVENTAVNNTDAVTPVVTTTTLNGSQSSRGVFTEFQIPLFGRPNATTALRRLDLNLAGRYDEVGPFSKAVPKIGVSWAPVQSVLVRASWGQGFRAPSVTEYMIPLTVQTSTISDPRRNPPSTPNVVVNGGSNPSPEPETSETTFAGIVYEPAFAKGLSLQVNYYDTKQADTLQQLSAQTIVNNEPLFEDRVIRSTPTADDIALKQPGAITAVNRVFVNYGHVENRSMDFVVDYNLPWETLGHWHLNLTASHTLESTRLLAPGQPEVVLDGDTGSPPKWALNGSLFWRKGSWNASAFLWYLDGFDSNNSGNVLVQDNTTIKYYKTPAVSKLDLRIGYEFRNGVWRNYGKGLNLSVGVANVFDKEPPFSDTVWGFNAGTHSQLIQGRTYEFSFVLPF